MLIKIKGLEPKKIYTVTFFAAFGFYTFTMNNKKSVVLTSTRKKNKIVLSKKKLKSLLRDGDLVIID
ncbi:hypothetical protein D3C75_684340 [compost metagenome]